MLLGKGMANITVKLVTVVAYAALLSACATDNALLQSPQSNTTLGIDQINDELDSFLEGQAPPPIELDQDLADALMPPLDLGAGQAEAEPRFDIAVVDHPAKDFFQSLVAESGKNVVVHPDVSGTISLNIKDVTVSEVLHVCKELYGYEFDASGRFIMVYPSGLRTRIFQIDYLDITRTGGSETQVSSGQITQSDDSYGDEGGESSSESSRRLGTQIKTRSESRFWRNLERTLSLIIGDDDGHSVVITPSAGVIVVRADNQELWAIEEYLKSAELTLRRQVLIEAKILEVDLGEGYQQGIDWSFTEEGSFDMSGIAQDSLTVGQAARTVTAGNAGGVFSTALKLGSFNATIDLLGTQGNVQVLSSPRIATVNNQKAVIKVGTDEYFVTDIEFESDSDADTNSTDIDFTPFFSGIALDVTPQISDDGKIILHIHPAISEVEDQQKIITIGGDQIDLPLALSTIRESDSIITADDGQIVVIGGLIQTRSVDENSSVPFFGDIPLVGELFKQKSKKLTRTELVILLRPKLTDNEVFLEDIRQSRERFGGFRESLRSAPETSFYD
jgi:MSHA biogenesis protein MshL